MLHEGGIRDGQVFVKLLTNRAACHLSLARPLKALQDCTMAVQVCTALAPTPGGEDWPPCLFAASLASASLQSYVWSIVPVVALCITQQLIQPVGPFKQSSICPLLHPSIHRPTIHPFVTLTFFVRHLCLTKRKMQSVDPRSSGNFSLFVKNLTVLPSQCSRGFTSHTLAAQWLTYQTVLSGMCGNCTNSQRQVVRGGGGANRLQLGWGVKAVGCASIQQHIGVTASSTLIS